FSVIRFSVIRFSVIRFSVIRFSVIRFSVNMMTNRHRDPATNGLRCLCLPQQAGTNNGEGLQ
ncbi:MAG: hypothetical protein KDD78_14875, partial [Caldilineaceae bacterium]|nr:hypothetical protein [Caldilineaceae bacterium]